jgi:hypothetical protein
MSGSACQLTSGALSQTTWSVCAILSTIIFLIWFPTTTVEMWKPDTTTTPAEEVKLLVTWSYELEKYLNLICQSFRNSI